ncbi:hypothetical protein Hanom_Chr11g01051371 [Helianthus anomalus]
MEITQIKLFIVLLYILSMIATSSIHAKDFKYCSEHLLLSNFTYFDAKYVK